MSLASILGCLLWGRRREVIVIDRTAPKTVTIVPTAPEVHIVQPDVPRVIIVKPGNIAPRRIVVKEIVRKKR